MNELEELKAENRQLLADIIGYQQKRLEDIAKYRELKQAFLDGLEFCYEADELECKTGMPPKRCQEIQELYIKLSKK